MTTEEDLRRTADRLRDKYDTSKDQVMHSNTRREWRDLSSGAQVGIVIAILIVVAAVVFVVRTVF